MSAEPLDREALVAIGNFAEPLSAEAVRAGLRAQGLDAWVFDGEVARLDGLLVPALGGVRVMVRLHDRNRALSLMEQASNAPDEEGDEPDFDPRLPHCPLCHSREVRFRPLPRPSDAIARFLRRILGDPVAGRCRACGHAWRA